MTDANRLVDDICHTVWADVPPAMGERERVADMLWRAYRGLMMSLYYAIPAELVQAERMAWLAAADAVIADREGVK